MKTKGLLIVVIFLFSSLQSDNVNVALATLNMTPERVGLIIVIVGGKPVPFHTSPLYTHSIYRTPSLHNSLL